MHSDGDCDALSWWNVNEPNDWGSGEDCAHIRSSASSIYVLLNDIGCSYTGVDYFICDAPSDNTGFMTSEADDFITSEEDDNGTYPSVQPTSGTVPFPFLLSMFIPILL